MPRTAVRTFLFSDLRDYTVVVETRGDAAGQKLLRAYRRIVRAEVAAHRGAEIKTEGDSFYVVFREPSRAVRCALGIARRVAAHDRRNGGGDPPIRVGIGINTGEAVVHDEGYVGSAVIVAQRLTARAAAGQILVTDTVRSLIRTSGLAPTRDLGAWIFKGVSEPVRVHEVDSRGAARTSALGPALRIPAMLLDSRPSDAQGLVVCPELVQRESQVAALFEHLAAAASGETRIVALSGEAGIGKSRLCREIARIADTEGFYVLGGRSHGAADAPYEPIVAALRPYAQARGTEVLRRVLGGLTTELRRLLPEIDGEAAAPDAALPDDERRDRFFRTVQLLLEDAAAVRPVLLVIEDLQDADAASRELLRYLAGTLRTGILLVVAYREEQVSSGDAAAALLAELDRQRVLTTLELRRLDREGVARMVRAMAPDRASDELVGELHERSEGVPFYVEELLKTALDAERPGARLRLPRTVRDSVQTRVRRLAAAHGQGAVELIEAVAVAGVPLGRAMLDRLAGDDEAARDIAAAVDAQLLERAPTQAEIYRFRHALIREAVAETIPAERRRRLALRVGTALEGSVDPAENATQLSRLFAAGGDAAKALGYARLAADRALAVGAYGSAIDVLAEAVEHARGTPDERPTLEQVALALQAAGRAVEAEAALRRAREVASSAGDVKAVAGIDVRLATVLRMEGRHADAVEAAKRAVRALEPGSSAALAEAVCTLASLAWSTNDARATARLAARALG
ncbi:MAG: AAA family ATPase, partial [Candidatus Limnocylindria bacterium]